MSAMVRSRYMALSLALLGILWAGLLPAQGGDRQPAVVSGGHASSGGRSAAPAAPPMTVRGTANGSVHPAATSGRTAVPMVSQPSHHPSYGGYDPGAYYGYYNTPFYRYSGMCGLFYGMLYTRYYGLYPSLFRTLPAASDLYLTRDSVKTALRDSVQKLGALTAAYENLKGLEDGAIGANMSPQERKREVKMVLSQIRRLSGQIKDDPFLSMLDQRKEKDILKTSKGSVARVEDLEQLGQLIQSLRKELSSFSDSPSVVSVKSFTAPSVRSLVKGIDKLAKRLS